MRVSSFTRSFTESRTILTLWYVAFCLALIALLNFGAFAAQQTSLTPTKSINYSETATSPTVAITDADNTRTTTVDDIRKRFGQNLMIVDSVLILFSTAISYILSGVTLRPIRKTLEDQEEFAQEASHELRTPLSIMALEFESLKRSDKHFFANHQEAFRRIDDELKHMQTLVGSLLASVTPYEHGTRKKAASVKVADAAHAAFLQLQELARAKHLTYTFSASYTGSIEGEESAIRQVVTILLENAIKYSQENGSVTLKVQAADRGVRIIVADTGTGVSAQDLPHIFDRFYRAKNHRSTKTVEGAGLGLSIARKLIEVQKGTISVRSKLNNGTTVEVYLPA